MTKVKGINRVAKVAMMLLALIMVATVFVACTDPKTGEDKDALLAPKIGTIGNVAGIKVGENGTLKLTLKEVQAGVIYSIVDITVSNPAWGKDPVSLDLEIDLTFKDTQFEAKFEGTHQDDGYIENDTIYVAVGNYVIDFYVEAKLKDYDGKYDDKAVRSEKVTIGLDVTGPDAPKVPEVEVEWVTDQE
jgi:hypothetical protein